MAIFADDMSKIRVYFGALIVVVALCSCDFAKNNKALISEAGKALVEELDKKDGEAGACDVFAGAAEADDKLVMQASPKGTPEQILKRTGYVASYNKTTLLPNWVAWHLTKERTDGSARRSDVDFAEDTEVPEPRATDWDYYNSGYDRGHMCPAADNKWSKKAMEESFLFTNMCPQNGNLNRGDWNEMEMACRKWAKKYGNLYIVCGPILYKGKHKTIGKNKVVVPEAFFKVVLRTGDDPQAIGFIYKNTSGNRPKDSYVNTVDEVERITGIDFFPSLPDDVEKKVEAECDLSLW